MKYHANRPPIDLEQIITKHAGNPAGTRPYMIDGRNGPMNSGGLETYWDCGCVALPTAGFGSAKVTWMQCSGARDVDVN